MGAVALPLSLSLPFSIIIFEVIFIKYVVLVSILKQGTEKKWFLRSKVNKINERET